MERRTAREKLIRVLTVKRKQIEHVLLGSSSKRAADRLKEEKCDKGSSSSSSSSLTSLSSSKSPVPQIQSGRMEFFPSCCRIREAERKAVQGLGFREDGNK